MCLDVSRHRGDGGISRRANSHLHPVVEARRLLLRRRVAVPFPVPDVQRHAHQRPLELLLEGALAGHLEQRVIDLIKCGCAVAMRSGRRGQCRGGWVRIATGTNARGFFQIRGSLAAFCRFFALTVSAKNRRKSRQTSQPQRSVTCETLTLILTLILDPDSDTHLAQVGDSLQVRLLVGHLDKDKVRERPGGAVGGVRERPRGAVGGVYGMGEEGVYDMGEVWRPPNLTLPLTHPHLLLERGLQLIRQVHELFAQVGQRGGGEGGRDPRGGAVEAPT